MIALDAILHATGARPDRRGEVHVDCPLCGKPAMRGQVHFSFNAIGGYCFVCGGRMTLPEIAAYYGVSQDEPISQEERRLRRIEWEQKRQAEKQADLERRLSALEQMHRCQDHLRYHRQMEDQHREYWRAQGIYERAQDEHLLGYCPQCPTCHESPSYTIPVFGYDGELVNIRHRLVNDNDGGKYRPHVAGLGAQLFGADILRQQSPRVLVLEGEKKAIVYQQNGYAAVGTMGKNSWRMEWFTWFEPHAETIICLDPDAVDAAWNLAALFARRGLQARVATFPVKPDDMIVRYGARLEDIEAVLAAARPV